MTFLIAFLYIILGALTGSLIAASFTFVVGLILKFVLHLAGHNFRYIDIMAAMYGCRKIY